MRNGLLPHTGQLTASHTGPGRIQYDPTYPIQAGRQIRKPGLLGKWALFIKQCAQALDVWPF